MVRQKTNDSIPEAGVSGLAGFRAVSVLVAGLVLVWVFLSLAHYFEARDQVRELLRGQAQAIATTMAIADWQTSRALDRVESEQAKRLETIGMWLRRQDAERPLTFESLRKVTEVTDVFNVVVFDAEGRREYALRGRWFRTSAGFYGFR